MTGLHLLGSEFKMLGPLKAELFLGLAFLTFQPQDDLTCGLRLFVKDGLGLSTESHLLGIITALSLCKVGRLSGLVLGDFVDLVLSALGSGAVRLALFRYIHHDNKKCILSK